MVLKPDKQQSPLKGLLEPTAGLYPRVSCSVGLGQAQEFSNKFSGDAEVACLGNYHLQTLAKGIQMCT